MAVCLLLALAVWFGGVWTQHKMLHENVIRLHVVADSDEPQAQNVKMQVKEAVMAYLEQALAQVPTAQEAKAFLQANLQKLEQIANETLEKAGSACKAVVQLVKTSFATRQYDSFTLPAGVYDALRITIGSGSGQNWWCVVFPGLCTGPVADAFAEAGWDTSATDSLTGALTGERPYQLRFFLLDCLGWLENFFFGE